mmetsp:Transcript_14127/g.27130  ORF Transcript_14127/g.27130 Transcript_14127/m.27130 type:complete len:334 (-) Transcript_14127:270-1271(-)
MIKSRTPSSVTSQQPTSVTDRSARAPASARTPSSDTSPHQLKLSAANAGNEAMARSESSVSSWHWATSSSASARSAASCRTPASSRDGQSERLSARRRGRLVTSARTPSCVTASLQACRSRRVMAEHAGSSRKPAAVTRTQLRRSRLLSWSSPPKVVIAASRRRSQPLNRRTRSLVRRASSVTPWLEISWQLARPRWVRAVRREMRASVLLDSWRLSSKLREVRLGKFPKALKPASPTCILPPRSRLVSEVDESVATLSSVTSQHPYRLRVRNPFMPANMRTPTSVISTHSERSRVNNRLEKWSLLTSASTAASVIPRHPLRLRCSRLVSPLP